MRSELLTLVVLSLALGATCPAQVSSGPQKTAVQPCGGPAETASSPLQIDAVKRIFVDNFGDDAISKEMQSMIVTSLVSSKRFTVTENSSRADAELKGVALERTSQELHSYSEGTVVRQAGIADSSTHTETLDEAKLSLRLVSSDGDVIWTTTQESKGGKYKSASGDVADLCIRQLLRDVEKAIVSKTSPVQVGSSVTPNVSSETK